MPVNGLGICPQTFQVIQFPGFGLEHMENNVPKVGENPLVVLGSFELPKRPLIAFEAFIDFFYDGPHLPCGCPCRNDEKVADGGDFPQIEHDHILSPQIIGNPGDFAGT